MRIHLNTIGCRLNEAELESWSRGFLAQGHQLTTELAEADLVVINSCAVTGEAARKSRKLINRIKRTNPQARLVVSGCYASLEPVKVKDISGVDLVVNNPEKDQLVDIASHQLGLDSVVGESPGIDGDLPLPHGRQRAFIKVQDGCRHSCTFCIVTTARGEERSRPISEIVDEINQLHSAGVQEAILTGVHIGGYGSDMGSDLSELIGRVLAESDIPRLRLGAVEPWDLPDGFWGLFANPRLMPHLHLPLQSGSDAVLKRMARRCKREEFAALVEQARRYIEDFNITTDIIVGFPGETTDEWEQTLSLVEQIGFGHLHIFGYSPRSGTLAADMPNQVAPDIIRQRSQELHLLGERMKRATLEQYLGRTLPVLIEGNGQLGSGGTRIWRGYTPNFLRVEAVVAKDLQLHNKIIPLQMTALTPAGDELLATPAED
jgi:threonylcarbamoyladenosine tRNA methylthiotransferase MtaB